MIGKHQEYIDYLKPLIAKKNQEQVNDDDTTRSQRIALRYRNLENNFGDINSFANRLSNYFYNLTHNTGEKSLEEKLHDRLVAISVVYDILHEIDIDSDSFSKRLQELECQYEKISYMYGDVLGLDDNIIINRGRPFDFYGQNTFLSKFAKVYGSNTEIDIESVYNDLYQDSENWLGTLGCYRDNNRKLIFPNANFGEPRPYRLGDSEREKFISNNKNEVFKRCYPGVPGKIDILYDKVLKPYYDEIDLDPESNYDDILQRQD